MKKVLFILPALALICGAIWYFLIYEQEDNATEIEDSEVVKKSEEKPKQKKKKVKRSLTTGKDLSKFKSAENYFMTSIENSPMARPQSGLSEADVVYEIETEAATTRFLALFNDKNPSKVGPVRSTRHYFLPQADSWNSTFYHFGRSKFSDKAFDKMKVEHIDGTYNYGAKYYERDNNRQAPHNAYLMIDKLDNEVNKPKNKMFKHVSKYRAKGDSAKTVKVTYNKSTNVEYKYDSDRKSYLRFLEGEPHKDFNNDKHISAKNVIFIFAKHENMNTNQGHIDIDLEGEGQFYLFAGGKKIGGEWNYEDGGIKLLSKKGEKLEVPVGNTWIQVVRDSKKDSVVFE